MRVKGWDFKGPIWINNLIKCLSYEYMFVQKTNYITKHKIKSNWFHISYKLFA